ncbi:MAG TPA: S24/S26 family peptidase [Vicinamibacteria bacterium]|nr:S24/S26 family peptidase [Vicinamibacteria bacterium]
MRNEVAGGLDPARPVQRGSDLAVPLIEDLLGEGRSVSFEVDGHSMTPFIRRGDRVTVRPRRTRPSFGDVLVVVADARRLTVHRHVGWADGLIVPRGDCAPAPDPPVPLERVLGVLTRVDRQDRRVRAGLGPERRVIAWLSRIGLLARIARLHARLGRAAPSAQRKRRGANRER